MKKGFTLIELLAVIVILAIIALIATPIVLGIIHDAKEEANIRSTELYAKGLELEIARKNLTEEFNPSSCKILSDGNAECDGIKLIVDVDGKENIYAEEGCQIQLANGKIDDYSCIKVKESKGQSQPSEEPEDIYAYMWAGGYSNGPVKGDIIDPANYLDAAPADKTYYLKFKLDNSNTVKKSYVCVKFNGTEERCLENYTYGWNTDKADSTDAVAELYAIEQEGLSGVSCTFASNKSSCSDGSVTLRAYSYDSITAILGRGNCGISGDESYCLSY